MIGPVASRTPVRGLSLGLLQWSAVGAGLAILELRPEIARGAGWTVPVVLAVFSCVLVIGLVTPVNPATQVDVEAGRSVGIRGRMLVLAAGIAVFAVARLAGGHPPAPATFEVIALNTLAAVAEEALFRRVIYSLIRSSAGIVAAVAGSAILFGLVHAPVYGWWAVPLDIAAGLVLGWQRWAGDSWFLPALTHSLADLLVVI